MPAAYTTASEAACSPWLRDLGVDYRNLFNCAYAAIETAAESEAYVEQCRIHHGARGGVLALGRSALLQKCELSANAMAG